MHLRELHSYGFDSIPMIVLEGRAFPGFPDEVVWRELGIDPEQLRDFDALLGSLHEALWCFGVLTDVVVSQIPDFLWSYRVVEGRYRPLGQWVWHIYAFADEILRVPSREGLSWEDLLPMAELTYWTERDKFPTFSSIREYGQGAVSRFQEFTNELRPEVAFASYDTPWGPLPLSALLRHVERHTAIHLRQVISLLNRELGIPVVSPEQLERIPHYGTLTAD